MGLRSKDIDVWIVPEEKSDTVEAVMGEGSTWADEHGFYVQVSPPEQFVAPVA
ncbi:MAG: hypothetical protein AAFV53_03590 [Myxococcota bacterium]